MSIIIYLLSRIQAGTAVQNINEFTVPEAVAGPRGRTSRVGSTELLVLKSTYRYM